MLEVIGFTRLCPASLNIAVGGTSGVTPPATRLVSRGYFDRLERSNINAGVVNRSQRRRKTFIPKLAAFRLYQMSSASYMGLLNSIYGEI